VKQKDYQVVLPVILFVVVIVALLSTVFFANANLSFSASGKNKSSEITGTAAFVRTDVQEELWNKLNQVMWENAKYMDSLTRDKSKNTRTMNAVDQMKLHRQITEAHLDGLKKLIPVFEALHDGMSDEEKNSTDKMFTTDIWEFQE
jgi:hypothetical protein